MSESRKLNLAEINVLQYLRQGYHSVFDKYLNEEFGPNTIQLVAHPDWQRDAPYPEGLLRTQIFTTAIAPGANPTEYSNHLINGALSHPTTTLSATPIPTIRTTTTSSRTDHSPPYHYCFYHHYYYYHDNYYA